MTDASKTKAVIRDVQIHLTAPASYLCDTSHHLVSSALLSTALSAFFYWHRILSQYHMIFCLLVPREIVLMFKTFLSNSRHLYSYDFTPVKKKMKVDDETCQQSSEIPLKTN